jgi:phosphate transport system substrate-binding protein
MKRKITALLLALTLTAGLTACNSDSDAEIHVITREEGSGTRNSIVYLAGIVDADDNDAISGRAEIQTNTVSVLSAVEVNESAIGYVSFGALRGTVRALSINGVEATLENVKNDSYALQRLLNLTNNGSMSDAAQDFWNFVFSAEGQAVIDMRDYVVHSDNADLPAFVTNGAAGIVSVGGSTSAEYLMQHLSSAYSAVTGTNATIEIHGTSSTAGEVQTVAGAYDIGMVSREVTNTALTSSVLAIDAVAVIVNNTNSLNNISLDDLRAVFMGEITVWDELE